MVQICKSVTSTKWFGNRSLISFFSTVRVGGIRWFGPPTNNHQKFACRLSSKSNEKCEYILFKSTHTHENASIRCYGTLNCLFVSSPLCFLYGYVFVLRNDVFNFVSSHNLISHRLKVYRWLQSCWYLSRWLRSQGDRACRARDARPHGLPQGVRRRVL